MNTVERLTALPTIQCPVCRVPLPPDSTTCPACGENLSLLVRLRHAPYLLYNEGLALAAAGDRQGAIAKMQASLHTNPDQPAVYLVLGKLYAQEGEMAAAQRWFESALARWPDLDGARQGLAVIAAHDATLRDAQSQMTPPQRRDRNWTELVWSFILGAVLVAIMALAVRDLPFQEQEVQSLLMATPTAIPRWTPAPPLEPVSSPATTDG